MAEDEFVIGRFRLQPGRCLLADGTPVPLGLKALDILAALVEAAGGIVTKSELMDRVWPEIAVEEHNIQVHISALRKALGRDGRWIVTVPRLGYRFVGPVASASPATVVPRSAPASPPNRLFGRDQDLAAIRALLDRAGLVTLVGPGGMGKTRLALEFARLAETRYRDGVVFVDLSTLQNPAFVASQVGVMLGIELKDDATAAVDLLVRRLASRELLILLDNCEHVIDAAATLAEQLLQKAPLVRLLATSREPLACRGEQVYRLSPLPLPSEGTMTAAEAMASPAVALLVDRLQAAGQRFELIDATAGTICAICRRLDGLPLAIEMVGALVAGLGLETVVDRLDESLRLLQNAERTAPARHRSLEATLDWSHALLSPLEQKMLRRLAVFPGRFSLEGVEAVVCDDELKRTSCAELLAGLVRKSLVSLDQVPSPIAYRLLESIRSYAAEKLEAAGERQSMRTSQARYVSEILAVAVEDLDGMTDADWLGRYGTLLADFRLALNWCFGPGGDVATGLAIVGRSRTFWNLMNLRNEGRRWTGTAVAALTPETNDDIAGHVWMTAGSLTAYSSFERSIAALRKAEKLFARANNPARRGTALAWLGQMLALSGQTAPALDALTTARQLLEPGGAKRRLGDCASGFCLVYTATGAWTEARREGELAVTFYQAAGSFRLATVALHNLADLMWAEGQLDQAIETEQEALNLARREKDRRMIGNCFGSLLGMFTTRGDLDQALAAARVAVPLCREDDYLYWLLPHLALRVAKAGRMEDAGQILAYAEHVISDGAAWQPNDKTAIAALTSLLHQAVSPSGLAELMREGRELSEEEAIALALA
jgi:predicted ATPase/DNA-binding winged helix-turn-helix (wHTH) protein